MNPKEGDIITSKTAFQRSSGAVVEYIYAVKDLHPTCLTYVEGSAKVDGSPRGLESKGADFARVEGSSIEWPVRGIANPNTRTFEFSYRVGADCARDVALMTTMHYSGSLGSGTYSNKGPTITVSKNVTATTLAAVSGAQVGQVTNLAATVTGGTQGDTVDFLSGGSKIGSGTLNANGTATLAWTPTTKGTQQIMAKFLATSKANASQSDPQSVDVAQVDAVSTTTIADVTGAQVGRASGLEVTVSPAAAGGSVQFKDGATLLADVPVNGSGKATYQWTPTVEGSHSISAVFSGRDGVAGSTGTKTVNVAAKPVQNTDSTTEISVGNGQAGVAQTISAQVTNGAGGTVTFKDGNTVIGTATVDGNGRASISWTPAVEGQRTVRAEYSGAGTVNASSDAMSVVIAAPNGGGDGGTDGGTGSLASLGGGFGSLGG
ncbi:Ig-like domain-containing protein [Rhodococcus hoagii]|nr:Ig-like domain-containing protein [Prescottella equi]